MQKEGWFDTEGWTVDKGYDLKAKWFPETTLVLGANQEWSRAAWSKAYDMWEAHGNANALLLSPAELDRYRRTAEPLVAYLKEQGQYDGNINLGSLNLRPEDSQNEELVNAIDAQRKLIYYDQNRSMTNFPFFLYSSGAERKKETVQARKTFYQADKIKQAGDIEAALKMYQQAFEQWKDVLATNESFHRPPGASTAVQEWSYERQVQYLELLRFWYGPRLREQEVKLLTALSAANVLDASPFSLIMTPEVLDKLGVDYRGRVPVAFAGPFDGIDRGGREPWISESVRTMVNARMNPNLSPTPQTPVPTTVGNP